jgi:hypothetical protein
MDEEIYYGLTRYLKGLDISHLKEDDQKIVDKLADRFQMQGDRLFTKRSRKREERIVVRKEEKNEIIKENHEQGHLGKLNTYKRIAEKYFWGEMKADIESFVKQCHRCQLRSPRQGEAPLTPITKTPVPFYQIGIDVMGPLPITLKENRFIVVAVDHFTKWPEARAMKEINAQNVAAFLYTEIICRYGAPKIMTSDRGHEFNNELIKILAKEYGIKHIQTTAYHPAGNGQVERMNRVIKGMLAKLRTTKKPWDHYLDCALSAIRSNPSQSTRFTPSELLNGFKMKRREIDEPERRDDRNDEDKIISYTLNEMRRLDEIREKAKKFIDRAQRRQKASHDKRNKDMDEIHIGDKVLLYRSIIEDNWSSKLDPKWEGPYLVRNIKGGTFFLKEVNGNIIADSFHRNKLKKYHESQ